MGEGELVVLLSLSSWCFVMVVWLFLAVPRVCLRFVIVVYSLTILLCFANRLLANDSRVLSRLYSTKDYESY